MAFIQGHCLIRRKIYEQLKKKKKKTFKVFYSEWLDVTYE